MKIRIVFFLALLASFCGSKSAGLIFNPISLNTGRGFLPLKSKSIIQKKLKGTTPFQGKRTFCSADSDAKYRVTIKGNSVLIVIDQTKVNGVFKKDKLFTNDPGEIEYRRFSHEYYGKYYVIGAEYFSVLNAENGEYRYYTLCK